MQRKAVRYLPSVTFVILAEFIVTMVTLYGGTPPSIVKPQGSQVFSTSVTLAVILNDGSDVFAGTHCVVAPSKVHQRFPTPRNKFRTSNIVEGRSDTARVSM